MAASLEQLIKKNGQPIVEVGKPLSDRNYKMLGSYGLRGSKGCPLHPKWTSPVWWRHLQEYQISGTGTC